LRVAEFDFVADFDRVFFDVPNLRRHLLDHRVVFRAHRILHFALEVEVAVVAVDVVVFV
jgi:hypothetical protein